MIDVAVALLSLAVLTAAAYLIHKRLDPHATAPVDVGGWWGSAVRQALGFGGTRGELNRRCIIGLT